MSKFQVGDVVKLKSGGPAMTVQTVESDEVQCAWFKNMDVQTAYFKSDSVEKSKTLEELGLVLG